MLIAISNELLDNAAELVPERVENLQQDRYPLRSPFLSFVFYPFSQINYDCLLFIEEAHSHYMFLWLELRSD